MTLPAPPLSAVPLLAPSLVAVGPNSLGVVALFAGVFVSVGLALLISIRAFRGFQRTRSRRLLALSAGLLLIVAVPKLTNLGLATATSIETQTISILTAGCRVLGLGVILASIYARE